MKRLCASLAVIATLLSAAGVASAQRQAPPADPAQNGSVRMELIDQTFDLAPDGTIELSYRLIGDLDAVAGIAPTTGSSTTGATDSDESDRSNGSNGANASSEGDGARPSLSVRVLNYDPLSDPDQLIGVLGSDPQFDRLPPVIDGVDINNVRSSITNVSPTEAVLQLTVPTDSDISVSELLEFNEDGVHPLVVQLRVDEQVVARHGTVVERVSDATAPPPPINVSLFGAIDDPGPTGTSAEFDDAVAEFAGLVSDAEAIDTALALAVPPSVAAMAAETGALDSNDRAVLANDELIAAPATPFDVSSAVAVGEFGTFVRQLRVGEDEVAAATGQQPEREVWPATRAISAPAALALRDLGFRYLAMPADVYLSTIAGDPDGEVPAIDRFIEMPLFDGGRMPILVLDEELGSALGVEATDEILAAMTATEWTIQTVAGLRLGQYGAPPEVRDDARSHLLAVPDLGAFDPRLAVELERIAATTNAIRMVPASDLASSTASVDAVAADGSEPRLPDVAGPPLAARLSRIGEVRDELEPVASMLPTGDSRSAEWTTKLDSFVSTAFADDRVDAELDRLLAEAQVIRDGVVAPEPFTFTLTGREGNINIRIGNELSEPLEVVVRLRSPRLEFPDGDKTVTLAPNEVTAVDVPVIARSNGTAPVTVEVLTPSLERLTEPVTLTSRFTALTGLGQVLTAAMLMILATWWFSHWRARRRARAASPVGPAPDGTVAQAPETADAE